MFFECCTRCKMTFTNPADYEAHKATHKSASSGAKQPDKLKTQLEERPIGLVPGENAVDAAEVEARIAASKEINGKRKKLVRAGIEAQTMKPDEVESRYAEEKKRGTVK